MIRWKPDNKGSKALVTMKNTYRRQIQQLTIFFSMISHRSYKVVIRQKSEVYVVAKYKSASLTAHLTFSFHKTGNGTP